MYNKLISSSILCALLSTASMVFGMEQQQQYQTNIVVYSENEWKTYTPYLTGLTFNEIERDRNIPIAPVAHGSYTLRYSDKKQELRLNGISTSETHDLFRTNNQLSPEQIGSMFQTINSIKSPHANDEPTKYYAHVGDQLFHISHIRTRSNSPEPRVESDSSKTA